jgi:hypothetical protein
MICPGNFRRLPGRGRSFVALAPGDGAEPRPALPREVAGGRLDQFGSPAGAVYALLARWFEAGRSLQPRHQGTWTTGLRVSRCPLSSVGRASPW